MFAIGVMLLILGYAEMYVGIANIRNGGSGPTLSEALGMKIAVAPPGAERPNLTGQPPVIGGGQSLTGPTIPGPQAAPPPAGIF